MSFVSLAFFPFYLIYLVASFLLPRRGWLWLAAIASSFFYAYWDWRFLFLLYYIVTVSWFCGKQIHASGDERIRKRYVTLSIVSSLAMLGIFKYFNFFTDSFTHLLNTFGLGMPSHILRIALPVGISFYTFHALSYTIDLYRRKLDKPADFLSLTVYLAFFPQLVAGPIVRAYRFLPQIDRGPIFSPRKIQLGLLLIVWGYFLKLCLADSIAFVVDRRFESQLGFSSGDLLFGIFAYSFQIYGDFAGYSLIAIGLAKLQGFDFPANFMAPYFSRSFSEFWRRWHISLSSFLRDYLYIPLGGNRHGKLKEYRNLFVTMLLGGLWHGASYNFVIWGALHGFYLVLQRLANDLRKYVPFSWPKLPKFANYAVIAVKIFCVYALVCLAWIFFRIHSFDQALGFIRQIASAEGLFRISNTFLAMKLAGLILITIAVDWIFINRRRFVRFLRRPWRVAAAIAALLCLIELVGSFGGGAFIYFQF